MKRIITCTVCPNGCEVVAEYTCEKDLKLTGNKCNRGIAYCTDECFAPKRTFTSSVAVSGATRRMLPVRTTAPIPKELLLPCAAETHKMSLQAPIKAGEVLVTDILGTGVDLIAAMTLEKED